MKRTLLYLLWFVMICTGFAGLSVSAQENTDSAAGIKDNISSLNKLALLEAEKENYPTSFQLSNAALELSLKYGLLEEAVTAYENLGNYYLTQRNIAQGLKNFQEAIRLSEKLGKSEKTVLLYKKVSDLFGQNFDFKNSLEHYKRYQTIKDSLASLENNRQLAMLQEKFEQEKAESEKDLMDVRSERQKATGVFLVIAVILLILVAFALVVALKKHKQVKRYLIKLNEQKDRMFSLISHGLRGPIGSVKGIFDLIVEQDLEDPKELKSILHESREVVDSSFNLLENLLNWSKSQTGNLSVNPQKISMASLVKENLSLFTSSIKHKNFTIENKVDENHFAWADQEMMNVVIRNILSNSVKFTRTEGRISLDTKVTKDKLLLTVSDTGVGMTREMIDDIMENDTIGMGKVDANYEKDRGIGLKICKEFLEKNQGKLSIESSPNKGSRFIIYLPLSA
ncbi:ATP-binding protein [Gaoshiqia sp. Z1-71]|uniref:ATP-binding protein n=1 Tax=Gaoshiqia hydrogeniformans TaxID=3290090 RepID=UPI003BF85910